MKRLLGVALLLVAGSVVADELGDANRLLAEQAYDRALPLYQKLAATGNAEAQLRLGEMIWFGDGTQANLSEAKTWFQKAADAGNTDAAANLASLTRRETHADEIEYWTLVYDGADMVSGKFACKAPELPFVSETKRQIKAAAASMEVYSACFNGFVDNMRAVIPSIKRIPAETLDMMTPAEVRRAQAHIDQVYTKIVLKARSEALAFVERESIWWQKTGRFVKEFSAREDGNRRWLAHFGSLLGALNGSANSNSQ